MIYLYIFMLCLLWTFIFSVLWHQVVKGSLHCLSFITDITGELSTECIVRLFTADEELPGSAHREGGLFWARRFSHQVYPYSGDTWSYTHIPRWLEYHLQAHEVPRTTSCLRYVWSWLCWISFGSLLRLSIICLV